MRRFQRVSLLVVMCGGWTACTQAQPAFKSISYDQALKQAAQEKKLVFIDFYTTWCGPCKMLDQTTLQDAWVTKWLAEKTVALKIDAEKELKLAEKFKVEFYPTLIFLNPEGKELERLLGYVDAEEFRNAARDLDKGVTALERAQQDIAREPDNPRVHLDFAAALARKQRFAEAQKEYFWCLDHGVEKDPAFARVRDERVIPELISLGQMHEPAQEELLKRRDAAERRILDGKAAPGDAALFGEVCLAVMDEEQLLSVYDALAARGSSSDGVKALLEYAFPALLAAKRYQDIAKAIDVPAKIDAVLSEGRQALADQPKSGADAGNGLRTMQIARTVSQAAEYFQVLLGADRPEEARAAAARILEFDRSADSQHALAWEGYTSGKPLPECLEYARFALEHAAPEDKANVTDTVARLMDTLGRHDEALALCRGALAKADGDRDRWILESCVTDLELATAKRPR